MQGEIVLDSPPGAGYAYIFGQKITGKVVLKTEKKGGQLQDLSIMFQAIEYKTIPNPMAKRIDLESNATLFNHEQPLYRSSGVTIEPESTFEAEFDITTPERSTAQFHADGVFFTDPNLFTAGEGFPLPPSLPGPSVPGVGSAACHIRYTLTVRVNGSQMLSGKKEYVKQIDLTTVSPTPLPPPVASRAVLYPVIWDGKVGGGSGGTMSKLSRAFKKNSFAAPVLRFRPVVHLPSQLSRTQEGVLSFSIDAIGPPPADTEDNTLLLTRLDLQLFSITRFSVVAMGDTNKRAIGTLRYGLESTRLPLSGQVVLIDSNLRLPISGDKIRPTPDFSTPLVQHRHVIRVQAEITHAKTGHVFRPNHVELPFQVVAPYIGSLQQDLKPMLPDESVKFPLSELPVPDEVHELPATKNLAVELPAFETRRVSELAGSNVDLPRFS